MEKVHFNDILFVKGLENYVEIHTTQKRLVSYLTFQAERAIKDLGDKVSSEDKVEVENKIESLREALKGSDMEAVKAGMSSLAEVLQRVSTAAYQAASV
ncbi:hypothetical protein B4Q13_23180, partial [Lacticaseibacillus rhamnosus]